MKKTSYLLFILLCGCGSDSSTDQTRLFSTQTALGEALYFDNTLSANRTQSCATCHSPEHAFIDPRLDASGKVSAVSRGDDGFSFGDRNSPTAAYARFNPEFELSEHARINSQQPDYKGFIGGQFFDGRASNLKTQAAGPPLNPVEMGMPDKFSVVQRIMDNEDYLLAFKSLFGDSIFDNTEAAYDAMAESIASFEKTDVFSPFDSKYDRSLRGEYQYDPLSKASRGKALFFSQQFTNCATCHQLHSNGHKQETFTSYEYHNIGIPKNLMARALNGKAEDFTDEGLLENEEVAQLTERGKFKVPTLRNIAVTGPYMHNGVFNELKTVIHFYDHFLSGSIHNLNPETGTAWREAEIKDTVNFTELEDGNHLDEADVEAMVCFLRTLTDARYEHLIIENGIDCGE